MLDIFGITTKNKKKQGGKIKWIKISWLKQWLKLYLMPVGIGALIGIGALVWNFGIKEIIKDNNDLNKMLNPDSTITYSGTIWSAWKKYGKPYGIDWDEKE